MSLRQSRVATTGRLGTHSGWTRLRDSLVVPLVRSTVSLPGCPQKEPSASKHTPSLSRAHTQSLFPRLSFEETFPANFTPIAFSPSVSDAQETAGAQVGLCLYVALLPLTNAQVPASIGPDLAGVSGFRWEIAVFQRPLTDIWGA